MEMATILIWLMVGFVLLVKGADLFVEGSASAARLLRVPAAVIGLTVVAFGTSAPELAVSVTAALAGSNGIALGNVIGSNMFNLLMVTGLSSMAAAMPVDRGLMNWDFFFSIAVSVVMLAMTAFDRQMGRIDGAVMLALFAYFLYHVFQTAVRERRSAQKERRSLSAPLSAVYIAAGLGAVVLGSGMVVDCASALASAFGLSENLIGLTVVALGQLRGVDGPEVGDQHGGRQEGGEWPGPGKCDRLQYLQHPADYGGVVQREPHPGDGIHRLRPDLPDFGQLRLLGHGEEEDVLHPRPRDSHGGDVRGLHDLCPDPGVKSGRGRTENRRA